MNTQPTNENPEPSKLLAQQLDELTRKHHSGASWFFWIAGLSLINSISHLSGSEWSFILGLGITQIIDGVALMLKEAVDESSHSIISTIAIILDLAVIGSFILWGILAKKNMRWAYIVGMIIFGLDGLIFLIAVDIIGIGFHAFALYCIYAGYKACSQLLHMQSIAESISSHEANPAGNEAS